MPYQIAQGWNNVDELEALSIQPSDIGTQPGLRRRAGNGLVYEDGRQSVNLRYDELLFADQYEDILTELGLASATSAKVTLSIPRNLDRTFANYNAIIEQPTSFDYHYWWKTPSFPVILFSAL